MEHAVNMVTARIASRIFARMLFNTRTPPFCKADISLPLRLYAHERRKQQECFTPACFLFVVEYMFYKSIITVRVPRAR